ncbi:WXG100-like domain-containing protein [Streptomyces montanisoli]|uniref:Outer membrane channel protein CpnT-like N-terminal domain-containing protein n=1 Tax=Streptomyces montanisoli TaxID=2798581 RepID=A0A940MC40_9ACTN|nr:hypothetical protein [Streptomyces montanisoli]MBP0460229.1 hypothetical protein [Streptomyces montanisoli]
MTHPGSGGGDQPIDLYPDDLNSVAGKFATGQTHLDTAATTLNTALQNAAGMAGNDDYGHKFVGKYDPAAKALFHTLSAAVRAIGQASDALVTTANNYLKADHHSNVKKGKGAPKLYPSPPVFTDVMYPDPDSAVGPGRSSVPSVIAKYWPNGHQDKLRDAASAYRTAATAFQGIGHTLHTQVQSLTDNNSDESMHAMAAFWAAIWQDGGNAHKAPLSAAHDACGKLATACDKFAHAIDEAHSSTEHKLAGAGIAIGLTTVVGILLTPFTGGGSDAGAAALDGAEAGAILGGVEVAADAAVAEIDTAVIADVSTELEAAAEAVPEIETVDAEVTEVDDALSDELAETESREPAGTVASSQAEREELIQELQGKGVKFSPDKVVRIGRDADGKVVFLEEGNGRAGLQHVIEEHAQDFANKGVPEGEVPDVVLEAVTKGDVVGMQGTRPIYEIVRNGQVLKIAVTVGSNGFIVGANPTS